MFEKCMKWNMYCKVLVASVCVCVCCSWKNVCLSHIRRSHNAELRESFLYSFCCSFVCRLMLLDFASYPLRKQRIIRRRKISSSKHHQQKNNVAADIEDARWIHFFVLFSVRSFARAYMYRAREASLQNFHMWRLNDFCMINSLCRV